MAEVVLLEMPTSTELPVSPLLTMDGRNFTCNLLCNIPARQVHSSERRRVEKKYVTRSVCSTLQLHPLPREELWSLPASCCSHSVT